MEAPEMVTGALARRAAPTRLSSRDLRAALSFVGDLADCESEEQLSERVRGLRDLLGADAMIVGTVVRAGDGPPAIRAEDDPPGWFDARHREAFARWSHQQPLVVSHFGGLAPRAEKVSDFLSGGEWQRREIYNDFYRHFGLDWEIAAQIHASPRLIRCAAIQRARADFGDRDRALLDAVGPHLRAAYARLEDRDSTARRIALLERGLESRGEGAVTIDRGGRPLAIGGRAGELLRRWFGDAGAAELPGPVAEWLREQRRGDATASFDLTHAGRRLRLRLIAGQGDEDLLLLAESPPGPPSAAALAARLPVSRREAEVLALLAAGRANAAIARDLGISPHTVARHLERVYAKLGVQSRTEATAVALEAI